MLEPVIQVRGLGKKYKLGATLSHDTLRDHITAAARSLWRGIKRASSPQRHEGTKVGLASESADAGDGPPLPQADDQTTTDDQPPPAWRQQLTDFTADLTESWRAWWSRLSGVVRGLVITGAGIGAVGGFILGMVLPNLAAALIASLMGVLLLVSACGKLIPAFLPDLAERIPSGPRGSLVLIVVATAIGAAFQWTIRRRSADK